MATYSRAGVENDTFVAVHPFMTYHFYSSQACVQNVHRHVEDRCFPSSLSVGGTQKATLLHCR